MPYVTSIERIGIEKGRQEGRQEALQSVTLRLLTRRLGELAPEIQEQIKALPAERLEELDEALLDFSTLEELKVWLQPKPDQ